MPLKYIILSTRLVSNIALLTLSINTRFILSWPSISCNPQKKSFKKCASVGVTWCILNIYLLFCYYSFTFKQYPVNCKRGVKRTRSTLSELSSGRRRSLPVRSCGKRGVRTDLCPSKGDAGSWASRINKTTLWNVMELVENSSEIMSSRDSVIK